MQPRHDLTEQFSTFLQFTGDRASGWVSDARLRRSMQRQLAESSIEASASSEASSEAFWALYWHQHWHQYGHQQGQTSELGASNSPLHRLAESHLSAYLQEPCYWAAHKLVRQSGKPDLLLADCFQAAIEKLPKVLRACNLNHQVSLKTYSKAAFENIIRDTLRQHHQVNRCNEWALLLKVSRKIVQEALLQAGLGLEASEPYSKAYQCYVEGYWQLKPATRQRIERPTTEHWHSLVQRYTQQFPQIAIDRATLEAQLLYCATQVRAYLYPPVMSLNAPRLEQSTDWQDALPDLQTEPMTSLIQQEEQAMRQAQRSQLNDVLSTAMTQLDPQAQKLLHCYYQQGLTQQQIAQQLDLQQYTVSRRLSKAREQLLLRLMRWSQAELHSQPTSIVIKHISTLLEEWLQSHHTR
jgi:RNA polymerase sigma factor (sigma-70 family)